MFIIRLLIIKVIREKSKMDYEMDLEYTILMMELNMKEIGGMD